MKNNTESLEMKLSIHEIQALTEIQLKALTEEQIEALRQNEALNAVDKVLEFSKQNDCLIRLLTKDELQALTTEQKDALKENVAKIHAKRKLELDEPVSPDPSSAAQSTSWVCSSRKSDLKKGRCTSLPPYLP